MLHGSTSRGCGSATTPLGNATTTVNASNGNRSDCRKRAVPSSRIRALSHGAVELTGPA